MTRIVLALVMVAALGGEAIAETGQAAPRLKELAAVTSEVVRIGDLVENAGASADVPVFRAPDLGQTGAVQVSRIAEALRPYDMDTLDTGGLTEVVVTRLSRALTAHDITDRIARAFAGQYNFGDAHNLAIVLDRDVGGGPGIFDEVADANEFRTDGDQLLEPRRGGPGGCLGAGLVAERKHHGES